MYFQEKGRTTWSGNIILVKVHKIRLMITGIMLPLALIMVSRSIFKWLAWKQNEIIGNSCNQTIICLVGKNNKKHSTRECEESSDLEGSYRMFMFILNSTEHFVGFCRRLKNCTCPINVYIPQQNFKLSWMKLGQLLFLIHIFLTFIIYFSFIS